MTEDVVAGRGADVLRCGHGCPSNFVRAGLVRRSEFYSRFERLACELSKREGVTQAEPAKLTILTVRQAPSGWENVL